MIHKLQSNDGTGLASTNDGYAELAIGGCVIGADLGGTSLRLALANMRGTILSKWTTSSAGIRDPNVVVSLIEKGVDSLLAEQSISRHSLKAIAAGAPGVTNSDEGVVIATSYLMGWQNVSLGAVLTSAFGVPSAVENDVNLAALAESRVGGAQGTPDFVFLAIGTGVGAGIILNHRLFQGMGWSAGEIGYMLVPGTSVEPAGEGNPGGLESLVGGEGIKAQWQALWSSDATSLPRDLVATEIFEHAMGGDALAQTILDKTAALLAYAIYNISILLNCPLIMMGGSVGVHPALCDATQMILDRRTARNGLRLVRSTLGVEAQVIGAVQLALDAAGVPSTVGPTR